MYRKGITGQMSAAYPLRSADQSGKLAFTMTIGKAPKHAMYPSVLKLWNFGEYPENTPIRAWKTISKKTGVAVATLKDWHSRGWLDIDPSKKPGAAPLTQKPRGGEQPLQGFRGFNENSLDPDADDENSVSESEPNGSVGGESGNSALSLADDPLLQALQLSDEAEGADRDFRMPGKRGRGFNAIPEQLKIVETMPDEIAISYYARALGFYDQHGQWISDHANNTRRLASLALAQAEGLLKVGGASSVAFRQLASEARRLTMLALELQARMPNDDIKNRATIKNDAMTARERLKARSVAQRAAYDKES